MDMNDHVVTVFKSDPLSVPRVCMLSCHDDNYRAMAEKTVYRNKYEYAKRWGHDLLTLTKVSPRFFDPKSHVFGLSWDRFNEGIRLARSGDYDWIYFVGADTLITNMTIPLTTFTDEVSHVIIANDCNEWNADSFLVRCSEPALIFLDDAMALYDTHKHHCWVEQQAMIEVRDRHPGIFKTLPQRSLNSYDYDLYEARGGRDGKDCAGNDGQWQKGDFLIHWAGLPTHVRYEQIAKIWPKIVR